MIVIPLSQLPIILFCLYIIMSGFQEFGEPIVNLILRKGFDFYKAVASTLVGLTFMAIGAIALVIVIPK